MYGGVAGEERRLSPLCRFQSELAVVCDNPKPSRPQEQQRNGWVARMDRLLPLRQERTNLAVCNVKPCCSQSREAVGLRARAGRYEAGDAAVFDKSLTEKSLQLLSGGSDPCSCRARL